MEGCIFCKIVEGKIPCYKIFEDEKVLAFLDINPYVLGHVLVVPKKHYRWIWDMPLEEYNSFMSKVYKIVSVMKKVFGTDWVEEGVAGIDVEHAHLHLFPRQKDDGIGGFPSKPLDPKPSEEEMKIVLEKIKKSM
jgi:histidine triad (HIT) family protein